MYSGISGGGERETRMEECLDLEKEGSLQRYLAPQRVDFENYEEMSQR